MRRFRLTSFKLPRVWKFLQNPTVQLDRSCTQPASVPDPSPSLFGFWQQTLEEWYLALSIWSLKRGLVWLPCRSGAVRTGSGSFGGGTVPWLERDSTRVPKVPSGRVTFHAVPLCPCCHLQGDVVFLPWATNSPSPSGEERSGRKHLGPTEVLGA